jgi:hypothetical protein
MATPSEQLTMHTGPQAPHVPTGPTGKTMRARAESGQEKFRPFILLVGICIGCALLAASVGETYEVIELVALERIVLASPSSNVGVHAEPIGVLEQGQTVEVLSCAPRKSQTDVEVLFNERAAIVWKGAYRLDRRPVKGPGPHATSSCTGVASF